MPKPIKVIFGVLQIMFWSWILYQLLHKPAPNFVTFPAFFIPAYYVAVVLIIAFSFYSGLRWIKEGMGSKAA